MRVLLVGGSGHVGTFITPYLAERHELRVLDVNPPRHEVDWIDGSIDDPEAVRRALAGVDTFVNLVMRSPQGGSSTAQTLVEIIDNYALNTVGLHLFLLTAQQLGVARGVHTSTMSVHHRVRDWYPAEESVPLDSPSVYGLTKGLGERICEYFTRWFGMNIIALRITAPRTRAQWLEERRTPQYDADGIRLYPTDEADLARAYLAALDAVQVGRGRFDAVYVVGDVVEETHNLSKARRLLHWEPRSHLESED